MKHSINKVDGTTKNLYPLLLATKANAADNPNWHHAMNGPDAEGYWKACETEINTLERMYYWDIVNKNDSVNIVPSTWAFKCKKYPDGSVNKLKARFCTRGDKEIMELTTLKYLHQLCNGQLFVYS